MQMPIKRKVEPLLTCKWGQYFPYNKYTLKVDGKTTPTGCVATATAQVMYHHKWPQKHPTGYVKKEGDEARKSPTYWWDDMKDTSNKMFLERSKQAVGVLMRDIDKAVNMRYYHKGSDSNLQYACNALRDKFDYTVRFLDKDFLPANEFLKEVMQEISNGYPVLVCGGPHAYVYDSYNERGFLHTNWGWEGLNDGYFDINTVYLNVTGFALSGTFWDDMSVVFAHPNDGKAVPFKEIERGLDARTTTAFTISKTEAIRTEKLSASIIKLDSYSPVKVYSAFLLTPNVVAQRLGHTSFSINMQALYNNPGDFGKLKTGKYSVTLSIKVKKKNSEYIVPITMKESFEIEVLPDPQQGTIELNFVDFLVDGANANYSTFQLNKIKEIGLQVHSRVAGYQIREGYRGRIYYRLLDLTENK